MVKKLRLSPSPAFAPTSSSRTPAARSGERQQIIFNPPSSAPNVYHTPPKFLPSSDPRKKLYTQLARKTAPPPSGSSTIASATPSTPTSASPQRQHLPPALEAAHVKKYHLTTADVEEMRALRASDSVRWTVPALAAKFQCSTFFVALMTKNREAEERARLKLDETKAKWGPRKRKAREDRRKRKDAWGREE